MSVHQLLELYGGLWDRPLTNGEIREALDQ